MKSKGVFLAAILTAVLCFNGNLLAYSGGDGNTVNPYKIANVPDWQELMTTSGDWNKHFILTADVNLAGVTLTPVGNNVTQFIGVFDGNDNIISNADINQPDSDYIGLFGYVSSGAGGQIRNLGVEDVNITGRNYVGGLVGYNYRGTLTSCYATGQISGSYAVGGLVGWNYSSTLTSCYVTGSVSGSAQVGGLVGYNQESSLTSFCYTTGSVSGSNNVGGLFGTCGGTVTSCYATGTVNGGNAYVGGLVGEMAGWTLITNSYATGAVSGGYKAGGLVGTVAWTSSVISCYATGTVSSLSITVGGLVGENGGTLQSCYSTGPVTAINRVGGLVGVNGSSIIDCHADGNVTGSTYNVGGLVGENGGWATVTLSYATGNVSGDSAFGGLVGANVWLGGVISCYATGAVSGTTAYSARAGGLIGINEGGVYSCYATGHVSSSYYYPTYFGGLFGENYSGTANSGCFWDTQTSGQTNGVGQGSSDGVYGRTTAEMKQQTTFTASPYLWDFLGEATNGIDDYWRMCVDGVTYPRLNWQSIAGDIACPDGVNFVDYAKMAAHWGQLGCPTGCENADINGDGTVDIYDLDLLADNWLAGI